MNARAIAAKTVAKVLAGVSLTEALPHAPTDDGALIQEMAYGVMRFLPRLEFYLSHLLDKPLKAKDRDVHALLLVGLYQLGFMRIPEFAAVSNTVDAMKALKKPWAKNVVNAILRRYLREKETLESQAQENLVAKSAHPQWLADAIYAAWPDDAADIFIANNTKAPMSLRVNTQKTTREHYIDLLAKSEIAAHAAMHSDTGITLEKAAPVTALPNFEDGFASVQDIGAQHACDFLACESGQHVLDACAAPGGKACHLLEVHPDIKLIALDVDDARLAKVKENLSRLQLSAGVMQGNAAKPNDWWSGKLFDRILLDAPCSATGVIRRHPDIKTLRRDDDIATLAENQLRILSALWRTLAPGGRLLYATCSILPAENEEVIEQFLRHHPDAQTSSLPERGGLHCKHGLQFLPNQGDTDGFYYAGLLKLEGTH